MGALSAGAADVSRPACALIAWAWASEYAVRAAPPETLVRIAFILPSLLPTTKDWLLAPQTMKLGPPVIAGYLRGLGITGVRQYDFELEVFELERKAPGSLDLSMFYDKDLVDRFLRTDDERVRNGVTRLLEVLGVEKADVFAFSCVAVPLPVDHYVAATADLSLCMAKLLKERYPGCTTVLGGADFSRERCEERTRALLQRCKELDFAVIGPGETAMANIVEHRLGRFSFPEDGTTAQAVGHGRLLHGSDKLQPVPAPWGASERSAGEADAGAELLHPRARFGVPCFDPETLRKRALSGEELLCRYRMPPEGVEAVRAHLRAKVLVTPAMFVFGCNGKCAFCCYSRTTIVERDIQQGIKQLRWLRDEYGLRHFHFLNSNLNGNAGYAHAFLDALIAADLGIRWSDSVTLRNADEALLEKMKRAGAIRILVGVECPSDRMLKFIHKGITVDKIHRMLRCAHELGIWTHAQFIAGMPSQTDDDLRAYFEFFDQARGYLNGCSINRYYLDAESIMAAQPERYGIEILPDVRFEDGNQPFNEVGGLRWDDKRRQIAESTLQIEAYAERTIGERFACLDLDLLFFLYDCFGHAGKQEIVRLFNLIPTEHAEADSALLLRYVQEAVSLVPLAVQHLRLESVRTLRNREGLGVELAVDGQRYSLRLAGVRSSAPRFFETRTLAVAYAAQTPLQRNGHRYLIEKVLRVFEDRVAPRCAGLLPWTV